MLLADEATLGKIIEVGFALCQYWADCKHGLLVVSPASLRKWQPELENKFNIPALVLDARIHRSVSKEGLNLLKASHCDLFDIIETFQEPEKAR